LPPQKTKAKIGPHATEPLDSEWRNRIKPVKRYTGLNERRTAREVLRNEKKGSKTGMMARRRNPNYTSHSAYQPRGFPNSTRIQIRSEASKSARIADKSNGGQEIDRMRN